MGVLLLFLEVVLPLGLATGWMVLVLSRGRGGPAWVALAWITFCPVLMMTFVKLCDRLGGTCPNATTVDRYHQAAFSLGALVVAAILALVVAPSRPRNVAFNLLILFGAGWEAHLLQQDHQKVGSLMLVALIVIAVIYEIVLWRKGADAERDLAVRASEA